MVKKTIQTIDGVAKFVRTDIEDKNEKWKGDNLRTKDGFYVIHVGKKHHIYFIKPNWMKQMEKDGYPDNDYSIGKPYRD